MDYYDGLKKELLAKREVIKSLTRQSKIQGDYYEALIRDFVRRFIPERFRVGYGLLYDEEGRRSRECDVVIYDALDRKPLFKSQDLVIVNSKDVKFVMQVKSILTSKSLKEAINNLKSVKSLNKNIMMLDCRF